MEVKKDMDLINKFLERGVDKIYPTKEALKKKLLSGERIRVYQGFDPTGPYLHVGHAMGIRALRILQQLGHEVIFLVGDYTAKVGDPDKTTGRKILTDEETAKNMDGWKKQVSLLIDFEGENPVQFKHNYEWLSKLGLSDLIALMSHATVQQMMERDMFARRLKQEDPIGLQEFIYPLMQGYDGVAMNVDLEIGGSDQTFNMLMGRHLIKTYLNKEKFVRTNKLMEAPDGITMSKTKGNGLNLSDSAEIMYGKAMSYPDRLISAGFELLTDVPMDEIKEIEFEMTNNHVNPMQFKKKLAFEITKSILGDKEAAKAQKYFEDIYQNNVVNEDIPTIQIKDSKINILELLIKAGISKSKSDARRLIEQGAVKINNELGNGFGDGTGFGGGSSSGAGNGDGTGDGYCKIDNWEKIISTKNEVILRVGKKVIKITKHTR